MTFSTCASDNLNASASEPAFTKIRLYSVVPSTASLGPGRRFAVWVQGCPFRCSGCLAPDSQPSNLGYDVVIAELADRIVSSSEIEGLTISGGEPFSQPEALAELLERVCAKRDLGVIIYSGYTLESLRRRGARNPAVHRVLARTDILIDGPYIESLDDGRALRGSSNQRVHQLTDRYRSVFDITYCALARKVEVHLGVRGAMLVGVPSRRALEKWNDLIETKSAFREDGLVQENVASGIRARA